MANSKISTLTSATTPLAGTEVLPVVQSGATTQVTVANLTAGRAVSAASLALTTSPLPVASGGTAKTSFTAQQIVYGTFSQSANMTYDGTSVKFVGRLYNGDASTFGASTWAMSLGNGGVSANYWKGDATYWQNAAGTQVMQLVSGDLTNNTGNYVPATAAKGINFTANTPAAGMTSQLLNWYEEGTWTPADASGAGLTFTSVTAKYTRIGRQVTATVVLTYPTTASAAQSQISGLPFAASNMGQFLGIRTGVAGASAGLVSAAGTTIVLYTQAGGNQTNAANSTATIYLTGTYFV
jgi:hypothetical protein